MFGNNKSGKSSIVKVIFQRLPAIETNLLEPTTHPEEQRISDNLKINIKLIDFPGGFDICSMGSQERKYVETCRTVLYIIDAQDPPFNKSLSKILTLFTEIHSINPSCHFEVFIHKIDGDMYANEDTKVNSLNEVSESIRVETIDRGIPEPNFHLTSIYDLSVYEAMSKAIQKIIPESYCLQNMIDLLVNHCKMERVYLLDVISKLCIANDSQPLDLVSYELCTDMIDMVFDLSSIYG